MSLFVNLLALAVPVFVLQVYDRVVFHGGLSTLQGLVVGMAGVLVFDFVLRQARARILQRVALRIDVEVGRALFEKVVALPLRILESRSAAHWQSLFRDVDVVRNTLSGASAVLLADLPFAVLFLGLVFVIAPAIAWILLVMLPIFVIVAWRSGRVMTEANQRERETSLSRDALISEMIAGRTTVKSLGLERAIRPVWEARHGENIERAITRGGKADVYANLGTTLTMLTTIALTTVGALAIMDQRLTIGGLIATNMLAGRLIGPLNQLVAQWRNYASFRQASDRLGELFSLPSERPDSAVKLERPTGELVVENLTFSFAEDAAPVVDRVSLKIGPNGVHALVGRNGSGKTTLLKLLQGLYAPSHGRVVLDGADIEQFTRGELTAWIGYVPQESVLFAGTVRDNIAHRRPEATDEQVLQAAKAAGVHQFIIDLPDGYATEIGEAGQRLSGGQRQRLAIARALVGDPAVLLLDEPSSNLDRQAEVQLRRTFEDLGRRCTVIVVTHSPILLTACQTLIALDRGRVALAGPAEEILPRLFGGGARRVKQASDRAIEGERQKTSPPVQAADKEADGTTDGESQAEPDRETQVTPLPLRPEGERATSLDDKAPGSPNPIEKPRGASVAGGGDG